MDIRKKTLIILCATTGCLLLVLFALSNIVVLQGFSNVEHQSAEKDTNRVLVALGDDLNTLDAVAYDWASQSSTRTFLVTNNTKKAWSRLDTDVFERLQFNFILLTDAKGTLVDGKGYDLNNSTEVPIPRRLSTLLLTDLGVRSRIESGSDVMGIIQFPEGPLMLAIRPVFSDSGQQEVIGYLLMGRYLDGMEVARLSSMAQLPLDVRKYSDADLPADFRQAVTVFPNTVTPFIEREGKDTLMINASTVIMPLDDNTLGTYSLIRDLSGKPALVMKVSIFRNIYEHGKSTTIYFVLLLIVAGLAFGLIILFLLEKTVISRILALSHRTNDIGKTRDFSARVELTGQDEIGGLATNVNQMLGELETSQQKLRSRLIRSEEKYRSIIETSPDIVWEMDAEGIFHYISPQVKTILGYEADEVRGKNFIQLVPKKSVSAAHEKFLESQKSADLLSTIELDACKKDRTPVILEFRSKRIVDEEANLISISGITRDITGRKQMEEALRQATKKLHLLTFITFNDIRNAVFSLQGYVELSKDITLDDKLVRFLNMQQESIRKITHSLDFAQSYQDLGIKPPQWQNVNQVFLFAISHLDFSRILRTINIDNLEIFADPLLEKVFFNLSENVLKDGMTVTAVSIGYLETKKGLTIIFEDNGAGIPDNKKELLFEGESGSKRGRGLFLAREILAITGITIIENGTAGKGARFEILVPKGAYRFSRNRFLERKP